MTAGTSSAGLVRAEWDGHEAPAVLLVDDEEGVRSLTSRVLRRAGYEVLEAATAASALRILHDRAGEVDLLVTDVVMPGMGGRELSEHVRVDYPDVPVLFMSGYTEDEVLLTGVRVAEVDFLAKPFDLNTLTRTVRDVLRRGRGGAASDPS